MVSEITNQNFWAFQKVTRKPYFSSLVNSYLITTHHSSPTYWNKFTHYLIFFSVNNLFQHHYFFHACLTDYPKVKSIFFIYILKKMSRWKSLKFWERTKSDFWIDTREVPFKNNFFFCYEFHYQIKTLWNYFCTYIRILILHKNVLLGNATQV